MPTVSVITPAYNAALYISDTINSVINQTFSDWEMIIVDDCSDDDTYKIANDYVQKDSRIKLIRHEKNAGAAAARNTALSYATGEYIAFLDGDDLWKPEKLSTQLSFMKKNNYAFTYTRYQMFYSKTGKLGKIISVPPKMEYSDIYKNTAIGCLTVMINRKVTGDFQMPPLKHAEDQCTWQTVLKRGFKAYGLEENLSLYRISSNSLTANKSKAVKRQWKMYRQYHGFSIFRSLYYLTCYAFNAVIKRI